MRSEKLAQVPEEWQSAGPGVRTRRSRSRAAWRAAGTVALLLASLRCGGSPSGSVAGPTPPNISPSATDPVLVGAGDIGIASGGRQDATTLLLDKIGGTVFTLGDNLNGPTPTLQNYQTWYGVYWGRHLSRTRPSAGNHDYDSPGPAAYFQYFGEAAGPEWLGYYSYDVGSWHVVVLNSNLAMQQGSAQQAWLQEDLESNRVACTVAYFHYPLFTSSIYGPDTSVRPLWRTLHSHGVEIVLNGHQHQYERFAPQDPDGRVDGAHGIREFVVGTGGAELYEFTTPAANSEIRASVHGVLKLTLQTAGYGWEFIPIAGASFRDSGIGSCH
jgi:acid phosphatase type 7